MIRKAIGYLLGIVAFAASIYVRFANPELTETQLIIQFWYVWVFLIVVVFVEMWLFKDTKKARSQPKSNPFFTLGDDK